MLDKYKKLMIIAPHPDDEILGCGGLISKFSKIKNTEIFIIIVSGHLPPLYKQKDFDITKKECLLSLKTISKKITANFLELPATYLKDLPISQINSLLTEKMKKFKPEILCIPFPDRHTDHRVIFDSSLVVARPNSKFFPKVLLSYETLSETHWNAPYLEPNFTPDLFINIDKEIEIKCRSLSCYKSQIKDNLSRSIKAVKALASFRGSQNACNYAEGYKVLRILT